MGKTLDVDIIKQLDELVKDIDFLNDDIVDSVSGILHDGAEIVAESQRKIISTRSKKLPGLIKVGKLSVNKKGSGRLTIGYDSEAIKQAPESVIIEFGRPGNSGKTYTTRKSKKGGTHRMKIGKIEPTPHIRKGFDDVQEIVTKKMAEDLGKVMDKTW